MSLPLPTQNNVERSKELCLDGFNTVRGVGGGGGRGLGRGVLVARGYNFACVKRRSDCTTVPTLLSMIVGLIHLCESKINGFTLVQEAGNSCCPS